MRKTRKWFAGLMVLAMAAGSFGSYAPAYAKTMEKTGASVYAETGKQLEQPETTDAGEQPAYVEGEAIVCFKTEDISAGQSEEKVKDEVEEILEKESCVDEAEALLAVEDASAAADETSSAATDEGAATDEETATIDETAGEATDAVTDEETATIDETAADPIPGMITLIHSDDQTTEELIAELSERDDVLYAEPNYISTPQSADYTDLQWGETTTYGIGADGWNTYSGSTPTPPVVTSEQVIALIDSGVDYKHEDLKNVMWDKGLDYPELVAMGGGTYGYNSAYKSYGGNIYDTKDPIDEFGHGTHCAGIMVAEWNKSGVSGVACGAKLMAVKVSNEQGNYPEDAIVRGYMYVLAAKKAGVNIVATNNSYSRRMQTLTNTLLVQEAGKLGIVCVYSAGNDKRDMSTANSTSVFTGQPSNSLVIGASDEDGKMASFSNYGVRDVDVFAPGNDIWSTVIMQTGRPTASTPVYSTGDVTYETDFSEKDTVSDPVFGLEVQDASMSIKTAPDGKNVLHVAATKPTELRVDLMTKKLPSIKDAQGGYLEIYSDKKVCFDCTVYEEDGEEELKVDSHSYDLKPGLNQVGFRYSSMTEDYTKENVRLRFEIYMLGYGEETSVPIEFDLRLIRLTSALENYESWNGTSMAAPMVTGSVAVLAAVYPNDPADKLAARVTGSVEKVDGLSDKCLSGGIFRLDKAIAGDTVPVPQKAGVEGKTITVEGYFFGKSKGTITVGGKACTVKTWSDEKITAELPEDYTAGENVIEITSEKGSGHGYFRVGKAANLYPRLPLPGSKVTATGEYSISNEAKKKYEAFYKGTVKSLIAMNGYLYAFASGVEGGTTIYRYQISTKKWETVLTDKTYTATDGITAWNGKIIFTGDDEMHDKTVLGTFDPKTKKVTWKVTNKYAYEKKVRLINNGYGIFLVGGTEANYGDLKSEQSITPIRRLDPTTMKLTELEEDAASLSERRPMVASAPDGTVYVMTGEDLSGSIVYHILTPKGNTFSSDKFSVLDSKLGKIDKNALAYGDFVATKNGLLIFGPVIKGSDGAVVTDNYLLSYDGKKATKQNKLLSWRPTQNLMTASYDGVCYVMGQNPEEEGYYVFTGIKADTIPQFGTQACSDEWVDGIYYGKDGFRNSTHPYKAEWKTVTGGKRYVDSKGNYLKSRWATIDGKKYYFNEKGYMEANAYRSGYYLTKSGARSDKGKASWKKNSKGWWYQLADRSYLKKCWMMIDGKWYYFKADGYAAQNEWVKGYYWLGSNCAWTYQPKGSWNKDSKGWWFGDTSGWYAKSKAYIIAGKSYSFNKSGYCTNP